MGLFDSIVNKLKSNIEKKKELPNELRNVERELDSFIIEHSDEYIYRYAYKDLESKCKELELQARRYHVSVNSFQSKIVEFYNRMDSNNKIFLNEKISEGYGIIGDIEGQKLDSHQMACIVNDAENHIVIAGAGTGKTTTIIGKVKYLLKTTGAKPSDFLILSFTNAAADEMKRRLNKETNENFYVATFHKLGYDIIRRANSITPKIFEKSLSEYATDYINRSQDRTFQKKILNYILYHNVNSKSEFSFEDYDEYRDYLRANPPTTINDEQVKSYGEMEIANFLAQHGIRYHYEAPYEIDTRSEEYGQYKPDFFLPDYGIYIEYFGIDRNGNVPSYFSGKDNKSATEVYQDGIKWKRQIHKENGTKLVECYAYEHLEGTLLDNLKKNLAEVEMKDLSLEEILGSGKKNNLISTLSNTISTVITLSKNRRMEPGSLYDFHIDKELVDLIIPVFESYNAYLKGNDLIDFSDMLNLATDIVSENKFEHVFKYVIVDEYQDISYSQYQLLKAMRDQSYYSIFCVGDDWQSIYRFAGSDIGYILNFDHYWGDSELSRIETTYRFSQRLIDISSHFIMQNPNQIKKCISSGNNIEQYVIGHINGYKQRNSIQFMIDKLSVLPKNSTVFFIGRYQFDINMLDEGLELKYDNVKKKNKVLLRSRPDLDMTFYTAHRSKGLQADYVFIINNKKTYMGFPSKVQNPKLVECLLEQMDNYPDSEERRLFYVALTRAKRKVFLVTSGNNISSFAEELISEYGEEMKKEAWTCPLCGGTLRKRKGQYGEFYGCSNYSVNGCKYIKRV